MQVTVLKMIDVVVGFLVGFIFCFLIFLYFHKKRKNKILELVSASDRYTKGDLKEKILLEANNEFKVLADAINRMASSLRGRIGEADTERFKLQAILGNMVEGVIAVDRYKRILIMNRSSELMLDFKKEAALGRSLLEVTRHPEIDQMLDKAISSKTIVTDELELHHPTWKVIRINAVGIKPTDGETDSVCGILVIDDVTEVKKLESMRSDFVANVSHELRTPLTSIRGFIETLLSGAINDPERAKSFLKMMEEDSDRLARLIRDLLELSKIESKEISLKSEKLDLVQEIKKILPLFEIQLRDKKITVENKIEGFVFTDSDRLKQIFINLIENAIKFNKPGGKIILTSKSISDKVEISIQDTGIGISSEMLPRIFERFFRVDKARSREIGGTGLGLSIVKHLVELHHGKVWCESFPGKGSTFHFTLPSKP